MHRFVADLVPGARAPYTTWTFVEVPPEIAAELGPAGPLPVRGTLAGTPFRGTAGRSRGVLRIPILKELLEQAGVQRGDRVALTLEVDPEPRPVDVPAALQDVLDADPELEALFAALSPSLRRAWARHVGEAKRPETRQRRASDAAEGIRRRAFPGER